MTDLAYQAIENIVEFSQNAQKLAADNQGKLFNRYLFSIIYWIDNNETIISAVMNLKQKPFYWLNRT